MRSTVLIAAIIILLTAIGYSKTLHVPGDYSKIQDAIDAAMVGDTVLVHPDTYIENIDFLGKAITVKSDQGPKVTVIDGNLSGSVVKFISGEGADSILEGFTLTNGSGTLDNQWTYGGGIFCNKDSSPVITKNIISSNSALFGAGISCKDYSYPMIVDNLIAKNDTEKNGYGGGICCRHLCDPTIRGNNIEGNTAGYHGGGIYCSVSAPSIINNMIARNEAWWGGGIFYTGGGSAPKITNSTIVENKAGWGGGGIYCWYDIFPIAFNSILWGNTAENGKEVFLDNHISPPSTLTISHSDVEGGKHSVHIESGCVLNWGKGMIDTAPLFENPGAGNYHLSWLSPCINRGTNENTPLDDIDGDPRPYMGTSDMGADEYVGIHALECNTFTISESSGGVLHFSLNGGAENANRNYLIYGSVSGTAPGTSLPGGLKILPINWDFFTNIVADVNYPDSIIFTGFFGTLDLNGQMNAVFDTNGPVPGMQGYVVSFAYPLQGAPWDFVSNPINVEVVP